MTTDYDKLIGRGWLDQTIYTDPEIFAEEMEKIFQASWVYVAHESQLPESGDYLRSSVGQQPVIVSRQEDGSIAVLLNRCRHRGAMVCLEETGNAQFFRCQYHGWTYRNSGELAGVTFPKGYEGDIDFAAMGLLSAKNVGSYRGFVFVRLSVEGPSLVEHLGRAAAYLDRFVDIAPGREISIRQDRKSVV